METNILEITKENYEEIMACGKPVVLDFWANWCMPCRMMSPIFEDVARERPQVVFGKVDVDRDPELAAKFRVMSIPMLAFVKDGELLHTAVGVQSKEAMLERIDSL